MVVISWSEVCNPISFPRKPLAVVHQGSAQELTGELPSEAKVSRVVVITDKVRLPKPAHGGSIVGCA